MGILLKVYSKLIYDTMPKKDNRVHDIHDGNIKNNNNSLISMW